jgi:hypothetical protein
MSARSRAHPWFDWRTAGAGVDQRPPWEPDPDPDPPSPTEIQVDDSIRIRVWPSIFWASDEWREKWNLMLEASRLEKKKEW